MQPIDLIHERAARFEQLARRPLDLLVVGGGIVGAGVARDAAMRGLRVGLVEQQDMAFGTSSRTSRLLHGGLRYLAQGRVVLVRQASREKWILRRIAPHLAEPLPFVFPSYRGGNWPLWQLRMGVKLYDLLCGGENLGPSRAMDAAEVIEHVPGINAGGLSGAVRYFDALTCDARLVLDTLRSAVGHGAIVCNYARWGECLPEGSRWKSRVHDVVGGRDYEVTAAAVVTARGPWEGSGFPGRVKLRLTKGVHLVVDRSRLPVPDAVVMTEGKRILFAIPWGERVILGTTDTDYDGSIEAVQTEPDDVAYVLGVVNAAFPDAALGPSDVRSTWAGLRPLVDNRTGGPSDISRAHAIRTAECALIQVAGGKLTTYRLIAEQVVDRVLRQLRRRVTASRTAEEPLLARQEGPPVSGILPPEPGPGAVEHYCRSEWAVHLDDVMRRRAGWHYYLPDAEAAARRVAGWMGEVFGWDAARQEAELEKYRQAPD